TVRRPCEPCDRKRPVADVGSDALPIIPRGLRPPWEVWKIWPRVRARGRRKAEGRSGSWVSGTRMDVHRDPLLVYETGNRTVMRYFRLLDDVHVPGRWHIGDVTATSDLVLDLLSNQRLAADTALFAPVSHRGKALDFCFTSFAVPVAKRKLVDAIKASAG